jgi:hypothetical protein
MVRTMKAIGYLSVSTDEQADSGAGLDAHSSAPAAKSPRANSRRSTRMRVCVTVQLLETLPHPYRTAAGDDALPRNKTMKTRFTL